MITTSRLDWRSDSLIYISESTHVYTIGLEQADNRDVWEYAQRQGFTLVTKDNNDCNRNNSAIAS